MISVKEFVTKFNSDHPDWGNLPDKFPNCDLRDLTSSEVGMFNSILTYWELAHPPKSNSITRQWTDPEGYRFLVIWTNSVLLRILIRKFTSTLPLFSSRTFNPLKESKGVYRNLEESKIPYSPLFSSKGSEHRLKAQLDDAARSVVANIEEGFKRPTTKEYLEFLGFSEGSLEEVKGDVKRAQQDGFLKSVPGSSLLALGIDLKSWKEWCQNPTNQPKLLSFPLNSFKGLYRSLEELKGEALNYEVFIELINKTDKAFRTLVESLERK